MTVPRTSPSRCATAAWPRPTSPRACGDRARCSSSSSRARPQGARGLTADAKQKISLGRGLVRADVAADPVRRAADRHRPAPEVAAAPQLKQLHRELRPHADLRHPRPDRGADLRRQGRRDVRGPRGADRHAAGAVRAPGAHLRRLLHRLAGHERPACRASRATARGSAARRIAARRGATPRCRPGARSSSASGRSSSRSRPAGERPAGARSRRVEDLGRLQHRPRRAARPARLDVVVPESEPRSPAGTAARRLRAGAASTSTPTASCVEGRPA